MAECTRPWDRDGNRGPRDLPGPARKSGRAGTQASDAGLRFVNGKAALVEAPWQVWNVGVKAAGATGPHGWPGAYFGRIALSPSDGDQLTLFLLGEAQVPGWGPHTQSLLPDSFQLSGILSHFLPRGELRVWQIPGSWGRHEIGAQGWSCA